MVTDTRGKILGFIRTNKQARVHDLVRVFKISRVAVHKQLNILLQSGSIEKVGKPPLVFYVPSAIKQEGAFDIPGKVKKIIDTNYLYISPTGDLLYGFKGFAAWVKAIKEENHLNQLVAEYIKIIDQLQKHRSYKGWIDATNKLKSAFKETPIKKLLYGDFYSIPKFGKTKLGQLVLYAKQSQNRELIEELTVLVKPIIEAIIEKFKIEAVVFIPPTVPRTLQFMDEFEHSLNLNVPSIELVKVAAGEVVVAQKTLSRLEERIINARETIFFRSNNEVTFSNILLIDDAVGSGATFNETAKKLKDIQAGKVTILAFAIVGSFKGFDVIREV